VACLITEHHVFFGTSEKPVEDTPMQRFAISLDEV
jgi:hypothetical protein